MYFITTWNTIGSAKYSLTLGIFLTGLRTKSLSEHGIDHGAHFFPRNGDASFQLDLFNATP